MIRLARVDGSLTAAAAYPSPDAELIVIDAELAHRTPQLLTARHAAGLHLLAKRSSENAFDAWCSGLPKNSAVLVGKRQQASNMMRASLRRISTTRPQARPSSAWAQSRNRIAATSVGFVAGALTAHQLARSDAIVSFDDMDRHTKAEKSKKLKTKQEHPTHSALDGGRVTVEVDEEDLDVMTLDEVEASRATLAHDGGDGQLLCTYDGIVYDVTSFADAHPGGRELLLTASGMDLKHFFENYTVHGHSDKAANWLSPLAVGKLSPEDALEAQRRSTPENHVRRRLARLRASRRRLLAIACSLPAAIAVRKFISFVGSYVSSSVAKWLARRIPFLTVPGYSQGAEPLPQGTKRGTIAVVGGGIAGCGLSLIHI